MASYDDDSLFNLSMSVENFKLKLSLGANPNIVNKYRYPLLIYLINFSKIDGLFDKVKVIFDDERTDLDKATYIGNSYLNRIIDRTIENDESLKVLNYILSDKRTKVKMSILITCVLCFNSYDVVRVDIFKRLLKDKRININFKNNKNKSVLDYLFKRFNDLKQRKKCLKLLIKRKELNLNNKDSNGNTILMRLLLVKDKEVRVEEEFDYFELKDIIIILLTDSRIDILIKNNERKSVRNMTNDIDFLKIFAEEYDKCRF